MRDEDLHSLKDLEDLEQYIINNPDDMSALMYSAYCQDHRRWQEQLSELRYDILSTQDKILYLNSQLYSLTKWQNFWRKLFKRRHHSDDLKFQIGKMEEKSIRLFEKFSKLTNHPPEDWRYKLAATGNNLFCGEIKNVYNG